MIASGAALERASRTSPRLKRTTITLPEGPVAYGRNRLLAVHGLTLNGPGPLADGL